MREREVRDEGNVTWKCVQAFTGSEGPAARKAAELAETNGQVEVICTPSGGSQSVRLNLPSAWMEELSDDELRDMISRAGQG